MSPKMTVSRKLKVNIGKKNLCHGTCKEATEHPFQVTLRGHVKVHNEGVEVPEKEINENIAMNS